MKEGTSKQLLVCDLDNTLYDWVSYFIPAFYAMVDEVVRITGCDRERLLDDFQAVHREHHDAEYPFALLETRLIAELYPNRTRLEIAKGLDSAFHAFNSSRKQYLRLYPGVWDTLERLSDRGVILVAHTESSLYAVVDRLTRLKIDRYFRRIYCRERPNSVHPNPNVGNNWLDAISGKDVIELSHHQRKPDPDVLSEICRKEGVGADRAVYVGDSIARDVLMAKAAGVFSVWAKYGTLHKEGTYAMLVRISHWTDQDIAREQALKEKARRVQPDYVLQSSFDELLRIFDEGVLCAAASEAKKCC